MTRPVPRLLAASVAGLLVLALSTASAAARPAPSRKVLAGSVPGWVAKARPRGAAAAGQVLRVRVYLRSRDQAAAQALARAVSDPASAADGRYLSAAQYRARFAPSARDAAAVASWLRGQGFRVLATPANRRLVEARATVATAERAFATRLELRDKEGGPR